MFRCFWRDFCASLGLAVVSMVVMANMGTFNLENLINAAGISAALGFSGVFRS